jgi:16S rRNA processing protein RimM
MTSLALDAAQLPADAIEIGRIADAWGIKGWFKIVPYSASPEALFSSKRWYLLPAERGAKTFTGTLLLKIKEAKEHTDMVVASAHEVPDRNVAELLKGARIFVSRESFPTPKEDEYYWVDLIGLSVINREGQNLGEVKDLLSTGPQTVLVIQYGETDKTGQSVQKERLIPFVNAFVDRVSLVDRRIDVDWQADY